MKGLGKKVENHWPNSFTHLDFQHQIISCLLSCFLHVDPKIVQTHTLFFAVLTMRDCALLLAVRGSQVSSTELFIAALTLKFTANTIKEK